MLRTFERNTSPGLGLTALCGVRNHFGERQPRLIEAEGLMRNRAYGLRKQRAFRWYGREMFSVEERLHLFDGHHAMVLPMPAAASRETRLCIAPKRKQRQDQREAEQYQQRYGY
jgi:hypothetical protein